MEWPSARLAATLRRIALFRRRFVWLLALGTALLVLGTLGFLALPGWNFSDALYMTVITLTAVGYQEVHPLNDAGRLLAGFLLAGGITSMGLWFALITSAIVEMDLAHVFRTRRTMKEIDRLRDHIVVCGAGGTGRQVMEELAASGMPLVAIELDPERADSLREMDSGPLVLEADATEDETLLSAGIRHARGLVASLSADTDNLFVCLSARDLNPDLTIVARAFQEETVSKLYRAGADHVVSPNISGGTQMASVLLRPQVMSFLDVVTRGEGISLRLEEVQVPEGSTLAGTTLADARIRERTGLIADQVDRLRAITAA
ncbi:MAG: potassium channel family protein [Gemmatimonadota bacterium]